MTTRTGIVAGICIALQALTGFAMLATSVHGVTGQAVAAPIYVLAAGGVTLWFARRVPSTIAVAAVGTLLLVAAPGVIGVLGYLERVAHARLIAGTRVSDVRDDPIISERGHPIGVRLTYTVSVPKRGYFAILPSLSAPGQRNERLRLDPHKWTVDGNTEEVPFEPGKSHRVVVELHPPILFIARDRRCLQTTGLPPLPESAPPVPLRVSISESTYGNTYYGGTEQLTSRSYDLAELYRGVLAEGLSPCE
jgi:hypothetical protein